MIALAVQLAMPGAHPQQEGARAETTNTDLKPRGTTPATPPPQVMAADTCRGTHPRHESVRAESKDTGLKVRGAAARAVHLPRTGTGTARERGTPARAEVTG